MKVSEQEKSSVQRRRTRYSAGGATEVNQRALEWWERVIFTAADDDTPYVIEKKFESRLDLIAALFLGEPRLWWVLAQYNNVLDASAEIKEGATIYIPSPDRVEAILSGGKIGGVTSQREVPVSILPIV